MIRTLPAILLLLLIPSVSPADAGVTFLTSGGGGGSGAWQNPAAAADWTWTKTATEVTLTGYTGPNAVVIPDMLDGLPVTGFGVIFQGNENITSVKGGQFIRSIGNYAFYNCTSLTSVTLTSVTDIGTGAFASCFVITSVDGPSVTSIGYSAFSDCTSLTNVTLTSATSIGNYAFYNCTSLTSVTLTSATSIGNRAFDTCFVTTSVYLGQNAPPQTTAVFNDAPDAIIYVTNPHATGWGDTWNGRPVVRLGLYADAFITNGTNVMGRIDSHASTIASPTTLGHVKVGDGLGIDGGGVLSAQPNFGLVWDSGSNRFWKVTATNLRFFVWGAL